MCLRFNSGTAGVERERAGLVAIMMRGFALCLFVAMAACTSLPKDETEKTPPVPVDNEEMAATAEFERALALLRAGDIKPAVEVLEALAVSQPDYSGPLINLGIAYSKAGQWPEAEQAIKMAIVRKPDSAVAYNQLGIVYRQRGRFLDAVGAYQRALELQPDYALAHLNLGVLYDVYLQQPGKALGEFERYVALSGDTDPVVSGWIKEIRARLGAAAREPRSEA